MLDHPFGYGARMCVGYRVAMIEVQCAMCRIVQDFGLELDPIDQNYEILFNGLGRAIPYPKFKTIPY